MKIGIKMRDANLRTCAFCEWIFKLSDSDSIVCPRCGFGSYGARYVYGDKAYRYEKTQEPWKKRKMERFETELDLEIMNLTNPNEK